MRARRVALAVALVLVLAGVGGLVWQRVNRLPDDAALAIGGRVVTVAELDRRIAELRALDGVVEPTGDPAKADQFRRAVAKTVAREIVLADRAAELKVEVPEEKLHQTFDSFLSAGFGPGPAGRAEFVRVLGNMRTSEGVVLEGLRRRLLVSALFDEVTKDVSVTDERARAAFPEYRARLAVPERRHLRNIVVSSDQDARRVVEQLQRGADFAALARIYSMDAGTRDTAGDIGVTEAGKLQPAYSRAAFSVPAGAVYGPVQTDHGWNVGQVVEVLPGQAVELDAAFPRLKELVTADRRAAHWQDWQVRAVAGADIRYADGYRPAD